MPVVGVDRTTAPGADGRVVVALDSETVAGVLETVHLRTTDLDDGHLGRGLVSDPAVSVLVGHVDLGEPDGLAGATGDCKK